MSTCFPAFAYINIDHPMVAWNTYRGEFFSAGMYVRHEGPGFVSLMFASMLDEGAFNRLSSELRIEALRATEFPSEVSRLSALFVFDGQVSANHASSWAEHFTMENLVQVQVTATRSTRADANWISAMMDDEHGLKIGWEAQARAYWSGQPCLFYATPIWERLVDGSVYVPDAGIRERALDVVRARHPKSLGFLEIARLSACVGARYGAVSAFLISDGEKLELGFVLDNREAESPDFQERLARFAHEHLKSVDLAALHPMHGDLRLLDLRMYSRVWPASVGDFPGPFFDGS